MEEIKQAAAGKLRVHRIALRMSLAYLIESDGGLILVDAGLRGEEKRMLAAISRIDGHDLRLIYITHAHLDHYGSAAALRRETGAPIAVHRADGPAMAAGETRLGQARGQGRILGALLPLVHPLLRPEPAEADILLEDGQRLDDYGLDGRIVHTPGHTLGSTCLVAEERLAFSGDLVTSTGGAHVQRAFAEDWDAIPNSVRRLQAVKPEWVYPGHGRHLISGADLQAL
ncbi:MAG: MBL fold metallo-hydrolase [Chloroflexota bacterium]|nr:MAG: MBL fold metallo-hydrolase [Chloroflexota bacterium]